MSFCIATITGNLTNDVKVATKDDYEIVTATIAVDYTVKGERKASFYDVVFYDQRSNEFLKNYGTKGAKITVVADIRNVKKDTSFYTNFVGRYVVELFQRKDTTGIPTPPKDTTPKVAPAIDSTPDIVDDDLPF